MPAASRFHGISQRREADELDLRPGRKPHFQKAGATFGREIEPGNAGDLAGSQSHQRNAVFRQSRSGTTHDGLTLLRFSRKSKLSLGILSLKTGFYPEVKRIKNLSGTQEIRKKDRNNIFGHVFLPG